MSDPRGIELIKRAIVRDGRSFLQYVGEAFPYTAAGGVPARLGVELLAREEQQALMGLIRFLQRHHTSPPLLGAFPSDFTTINFVALDHLLPALRKDQQQGINELERGLAGVPEGETRTLLLNYLDMKRRHLQALDEIAGIEQRAENVQPSVIPSDTLKPAH